MNLLVAPDLPSDVRDDVAPLTRRFGETETPFGYQSADPYTGPRCGRCNTLLHLHLWQLVNPE